MIINGIELDGLAHQASTLVIPPAVDGRVVHIDADFLAYQVSAERVGAEGEKSFDDMKHNAAEAIATLKALAGATAIHLHLTPSSSDKGRRHEHAVIKQYQATRADKAKPQYLNIMREHMASAYPATMHQFCEADDGMSSAQYEAIAAGRGNLSIIASKDKDLNMVPGLHLGWDSGEIIETGTEFGEVHLRVRNDGTKVLDGYGQKFFWAQMLAGDQADNISGLPLIHRTYQNAVFPIAPTKKSISILSDPNASDDKKYLARAALDARPHGKCGAVSTLALLDGINDHKAAFARVKDLFRLYGEDIEPFKHWATGEPVPWGLVFLSEARLLWMRMQKHNSDCVVNFMRGITA